jgi:short subunit dehydrogenase-like uncharacterized protein
MKQSAIRWLKFSNWISPVLRLDAVRSFAKKRINKKVTGPDQAAREEGKSYIWGEVENESGEKISARLITPEGYRLTAITSLHIAQKVRMGKFKPGYQTPASAYGEDLILEIENTKRVLPTS